MVKASEMHLDNYVRNWKYGANGAREGNGESFNNWSIWNGAN